MSRQTEAQRLAAKMKSYKLASGYAWHCHKAGDELLRLEAANAELLESLKDTLDFCEHHSNRWDGARGKHIFLVVESARAAIAKHGSAT